jgi:hypothetical protein
MFLQIHLWTQQEIYENSKTTIKKEKKNNNKIKMPYPKLMFEGIYKAVRLSKNKTVRTKLVKYKISGKKQKKLEF